MVDLRHLDTLADLVFRRYPMCPRVTIYVPEWYDLPNGDRITDLVAKTCTAPLDEQRDGTAMHFPLETLERMLKGEQVMRDQAAAVRELAEQGML